MNICLYYQAQVQKSNTWYLTAVLRSFESLAFDRSIDKLSSTFEFFVPKDLEPYFLDLMSYFESIGLISDLKKAPNRLVSSDRV